MKTFSDIPTHPFSGSYMKEWSPKITEQNKEKGRRAYKKAEVSPQEKKTRKEIPKMLGQGALRLMRHTECRGLPARTEWLRRLREGFHSEMKWTGRLAHLNAFKGELNDQ